MRRMDTRYMNKWEKCIPYVLLILFLTVSSILIYQNVFAQAQLQTAAGVTCPASGTSIQVLGVNSKRFSYALINDTGVDVRIGFLASGTGTLDDTSSFILKAGSTYTDSLPNIYYGRVVCMSTTGVAQVIHYTEAGRQ